MTERSGPPFGGLSVRTRIATSVAVLVGLALAGAGLVVYALESARTECGVSDQVEQKPAEFGRLRDEGIDPGSNVVNVYVGYLRKKFGSDAIRTVRGMGYRFEAHPSAEPTTAPPEPPRQ